MEAVGFWPPPSPPPPARALDSGKPQVNSTMANNMRIPRIELTRERSTTLESIQSLTRAIRESLRLHNIRREKKRLKKKNLKLDSNHLDVNDQKRVRSKSMDHAIQDDDESYNEISEVGVSAVVVSDFGPTIDRRDSRKEDTIDEVFEDAEEKRMAEEVEDANRHRRYSKSLNEVELANMKRQEEGRRTTTQMSVDAVEKKTASKQQPARQSSMPSSSVNRRQSKDDADVSQVDASVLRKRFARLLDTLRTHKFSLPAMDQET